MIYEKLAGYQRVRPGHAAAPPGAIFPRALGGATRPNGHCLGLCRRGC
jgi:hypothetical protein